MNKWGCSQCKGEDHADGDKFRQDRNCDGNGRRIYLEFDPSMERCPWATMPQEVSFWVNSWMDFDRWGVLPYGGGDLMAYPAYFYEAFLACETEKIKCSNEAAERENKRREQEAKRHKLRGPGHG